VSQHAGDQVRVDRDTEVGRKMFHEITGAGTALVDSTEAISGRWKTMAFTEPSETCRQR
jgi:hypothetical protein